MKLFSAPVALNEPNIFAWALGGREPRGAEPIGILLDGGGMPIAPVGPIFRLAGEYLIGPQGMMVRLAPFQTVEWIVNHGQNDQTYVLKRLVLITPYKPSTALGFLHLALAALCLGCYVDGFSAVAGR